MKKLEDENIKIGHLLQVARENKRIKQGEMCKDTGLTKNHISAVERGVSKASVKMLLGYCKKLNTSPNDILGFNDLEIIPELKSELMTMNQKEQAQVLAMIKILKSK